MLEGHNQNVNGVAFTPDGKSLVSASYDLTVRIWPLDGSAPTITTLPSPLNAVAVARDGEIVAGSADGRVFFLAPNGDLRGEVAASETPIIVDRRYRTTASWLPPPASAARSRSSSAPRGKLQRTLVGPGLPVWSAAFLPDNRTLVTGGTDRMVRRWDAMTGDHIGSVPVSGVDDPLAAYGDDRGAQVYRACVACHTLSPDEGNRAGPTLHGIFGRRIAIAARLQFLRAAQEADIVWTPETVAKLFEVGPMAYTPGTKMPEQVIGSADDRKALVEFLAKATTK